MNRRKFINLLALTPLARFIPQLKPTVQDVSQLPAETAYWDPPNVLDVQADALRMLKNNLRFARVANAKYLREDLGEIKQGQSITIRMPGRSTVA